jgi:putative membrane protein
MRALPSLAAALAAGLIATGSFALAHDSHGSRSSDEHHSGSSQRCDRSCHDNRFSEWDEEWLKMSIEGDLFEIQGGKLALDKATTSEVKTLADRLIKDHTQSLKDAAKVAKKLGIDVPSEPSPVQQWALKAVATFTGKEFDRQYSDLEVKDHMEDIDQTSDEVDEGCNHDIRALAKDDLPMLKEHLKLAQAALAAAGGSPTTSS